MSASPVMCDQRFHENRERSRPKEARSKGVIDHIATENLRSDGEPSEARRTKSSTHLATYRQKRNLMGSRPKEAKPRTQNESEATSSGEQSKNTTVPVQKSITTARVTRCTHSNMHNVTRPPGGKATQQVYLLCRAKHQWVQQAHRCA